MLENVPPEDPIEPEDNYPTGVNPEKDKVLYPDGYAYGVPTPRRMVRPSELTPLTDEALEDAIRELRSIVANITLSKAERAIAQRRLTTLLSRRDSNRK